jgi:hypothetical protein
MNDIGWCKKISPTSVTSTLHQGRDLDLANGTWIRSQQATNAHERHTDRPLQALLETETRSARQKPGGAVDKRMHIHRNECAELADLCAVVFLSSFGPRSTQTLSKRLRRT